MKVSFYNIFFTYEDKIIGYNSISDNFIILEQILYDLYKSSISENRIQDLPNYHETFYNDLLSNGFVIEDSKDELELIKNISYETDFNEENFELIINPTMNCNFKCWYCYETHIKKSKMTEDTIKNIIKYVENILVEKKGKLKNFKLDWFGGEPLLYFQSTILPLLENIVPKMKDNDINFSSNFTTNGLLINQNILDLCKKYRVNLFQITLDGHRDRHNKVRYISKTKGSYDEIVNNIKLCLKNNFFVSIRINISEETVKDLLKIIDDFKDISENEKQYMSFSFHEVWQEEKNLTVDISEIVDIYRGNGFICSYKGERSASIKNSCYADKLNQAVINYNGEVFKCTARDFNSESKEGILNSEGTITWNDKFQKRIYDLRFKNKPCLECKILPICNGGCSQHKLEHEGKDYCIFNYDNSAKLEIIKQKFYTRLHKVTI